MSGTQKMITQPEAVFLVTCLICTIQVILVSILLCDLSLCRYMYISSTSEQVSFWAEEAMTNTFCFSTVSAQCLARNSLQIKSIECEQFPFEEIALRML